MKKKRFIYDHLVKLLNTLDKKEEYKHSDHDDLDYFGIRDWENLFTNDKDSDDNYYKPIFIKSSSKNNYKYYKSRGDKDKKIISKAISLYDYAIFKWFNKWS